MNKINRMSRKIFRSIISVSAIIILAVLLLSSYTISAYYAGIYGDSLQDEAECIATAYDCIGEDYLRSLDTIHRISLISPDGTVLFDNSTDAVKMENHSDREEFREALENGVGISERYSATFEEKTLYVTRLLGDGNVLRLSMACNTAFIMLKNMIVPTIVILIFTFLLASLLARRVSKSITAPINKIDLENPEKNKVYEELQPLIQRLREQRDKLRNTISKIKSDHEKQDNLRQEFTANVSHELKTPLTSISGYAEIIRDGLVKQEDIPRFAGKIYDESKRLITLTGDIIKLSQLDEKDVRVEPEDIDLYEMCEGIINQLEMVSKAKNITTLLQGEHLHINGVEQIVEEMIFNICDNAVKYNKQNGFVYINIRQCVDGIELSVKDTGIGISKEDAEHVFERFYRADKSHSKEIGGTGLGLSIVKHCAMFMDAKLSLDSTLGEGTTISILF